MGSGASNDWRQFSAYNLAYLADAYERYRDDPESVGSDLRAFFARSGPPPEAAPREPRQVVVSADPGKIAATIALSTAIRMYGYRTARLDPLGTPPPGDVAVLPETHGIRVDELVDLPAWLVGGPVGKTAADAREGVQSLRAIYQGTTGYEFEHVSNAAERDWLRQAVESGLYRPPTDPVDEGHLLDRLSRVEAFERFLHAAFPTQTRFSIEGLDMLVPMLDELIGAAAELGTRTVWLGMAHRGRLNVLAHVLGKPYREIIAEFQGSFQRPNVSPSGSSGGGWTGDVRYHLGARRAFRGGREVAMQVTLLPNPSHLEFIDPVVEGVVRADSERRDEAGPPKLDPVASLAVLVHGEAAFVGEGIAAETMNLSRLPGYETGGTVHIIGNNQLGFTTVPQLGRSTLFASDLAKGFEMPVIHVNADDPEACIAAIRLAHAYVERFHKDAVIDLIGYRRFGHNEGDDPTFTQPKLYQTVAGHPTVRQLWATELARRGLATGEQAEALLRQGMEELFTIRRGLPKDEGPGKDAQSAGLEAGGVRGGLGSAGAAGQVLTAVSATNLADLNEQMLALPTDFRLHPKLTPFYERRRAVFRPSDGVSKPVEWAHAEELAFASILADGTPVRITGQDTTRGTFSQRHLVLHDFENGSIHVPLHNLPAAKASFEIWDSPLSEQATLGFEFGYSIQAAEALVLWEAQYGDFVDVAQVIVDEFVVSAQSKWSQRSGLVLLLPHSYEGQGPDHSSARIERFLHSAAEDNLRIANCTTAAQYFHILRRQAELLRLDPRPLVVATPKSLLRHPMAASPVDALCRGTFQPVIDDEVARRESRAVRRLILCSGKVAMDLVAVRQKMPADSARQVAIVRVEELYPFPVAEIGRAVSSYAGLEQVAWVQEEPRNMGPWTFVAPRLRDLLGTSLPLIYIGRTRRASPAEGSQQWHLREQSLLVADALQVAPAREVSR